MRNEELLDDAIQLMLPLLPFVKRAAGRVQPLTKAIAGTEENAKFGAVVTDVDKFVQDFLLVSLLQKHPELAAVAEESTWIQEQIPFENGSAVLIDPIDGTHWFVRGDPDYSTMFGIFDQGKVVAGFGIYPHSGELFIARPDGCFRCADAGQSLAETRVQITHSGSRTLAAHYRIATEKFNGAKSRLHKAGWTILTNGAGFGTNLTAAVLVLRGAAQGLVGPFMAIHDAFVPAKLIQSAGGVVRFFDALKDSDTWQEVPDWSYRDIETAQGLQRRCRFIAAASDASLTDILCALKG